MRRNKIIEEIENSQLADVPEFSPGDTISVQVRVKEGNRERLQAFEGVVIGVKSRGLNSSFIVMTYQYLFPDKKKRGSLATLPLPCVSPALPMYRAC